MKFLSRKATVDALVTGKDTVVFKRPSLREALKTLQEPIVVKIDGKRVRVRHDNGVMAH